MPLRVLIAVGLCALLALVSACASTPVAEPVKGADYHFKQAESAYAGKHYDDAIASYKKVRETFSSPELTAKAELRIADAHFEDKAYIEAAASYEDFLKLHPAHELAPYALYRLGMSHYQQITGIDTDQTPIKNAVLTLESFLARYPSSPYAAEVKAKLADCHAKQLAYENYVGNFYLRTGKYSSAVKRLGEALVRFPDNPKLDETLFLLGKASLKAGDEAAAQQVFRRLTLQFPDSPLAKDAARLAGETI